MTAPHAPSGSASPPYCLTVSLLHCLTIAPGTYPLEALAVATEDWTRDSEGKKGLDRWPGLALGLGLGSGLGLGLGSGLG